MLGRFITQDTYEGDISNPLSLNLYTYVENNPLKYMDPSGHVPNGANVRMNLENARRYGAGTDVYNQVQSRLSGFALDFFPGAKEDGNNTFNFLFEVATQTSAYSEYNTDGNSDWAIGRLSTIFQYESEEEQQYLDGLAAFVLTSLDLYAASVPKAASEVNPISYIITLQIKA